MAYHGIIWNLNATWLVQEHLELVHRLVKELAAVENTARDTAVCCGDCKVSYAMQGRAYLFI